MYERLNYKSVANYKKKENGRGSLIVFSKIYNHMYLINVVK